MIQQYPHTVKLTATSGSTQDSNGDWTGGTPSVTILKGRAEVNTKNAFITDANGTLIRYDWTVYIPLPPGIVALGTMVEVKDDNDKVLCKSTVKQFSAGQLNQRLWL